MPRREDAEILIDLVRPGKHSLTVNVPVMNAAGTLGWGDAYAGLVQLKRLGAIVTNPMSWHARTPTRGTRVVPLDAGLLVHTGLPNPGVRKAIKEYGILWRNAKVPIIAHLIGTTPDEVARAVAELDEAEGVAAIELGLADDIAQSTARDLVSEAVKRAEKPILVRLPLFDVLALAGPVCVAGASALVVAAPPRGTARDPRGGRLIGGRLYGPFIHPLTLRLVGLLRQQIHDVPIIGAGGIHSTQAARDYLDAGAVAVQVDSATWIKPALLERIARDLAGGLITRAGGAFLDEWHPDMGDTEYKHLNDAGPADAPDKDTPAPSRS